MTTAKQAQNKLEISSAMPSWTGLALALVSLLSMSVSTLAQARTSTKGSESSKGREGAKPSLKQKSSKKFAVKGQRQLGQKVAQTKASQKSVSKAQSKNKALVSQTKSPKSAKLTEKTKFVLNKMPEAPASATHELAMAFSTNQQNQLIDHNAKTAKPVSISQIDKHVGNKKMPSLLPTTNDSQRAASMLEAGSGVYNDDGYTRTQIVDAPVVRRPAAVTPTEPERVAITFEHSSEK